MCKECRKLICPPTCPSYRGFSPTYGTPRGRCSLCEEEMYEGEEYYRFGKDRVCRTCAEQMELDTLAALCGYAARRDLFLSLGVPRGRI